MRGPRIAGVGLVLCSRLLWGQHHSAAATITARDMERIVEVLASDRFGGRAPGTPGEDSTVRYLIAELRRSGLRSGNPDGSYTELVPLVGIRSRFTGTVFTAGGAVELRPLEDYLARATGPDPRVGADSAEVVFAGYGIVAPELGRDDYHGTDVRRKIVLALPGAPVPPDSAHVGQEALARISGRDAKIAAAVQRGAAALVLLHDSLAPFDWHTLTGIYEAAERDFSPGAEPAAGGSLLFGWIPLRRMTTVAALGGISLDSLAVAASRPGFAAVTLPLRATLRAEQQRRSFTSRNVVALVPGSDARLRGEYVVYTAHWDHFGRNEALAGDQIFNGAIDNAGGVAQLISIARAFHHMARPPRRTILFIATTAEEQGLLGAQYYVAHPLLPLDHAVAEINLDWFLPWGQSRGVISIGDPGSTLDDVLRTAAAAQGRALIPDPWGAEDFFARGDQFEFARAGVPALMPAQGGELIGKPAGTMDRMLSDYLARDYHQVSDEVHAGWDYSGAVEDAQLLLEVGYDVAQADRRPEWKPNTRYPGFKARGDSLRGARD